MLMFCLTALLGIGLIIITAWNGYQNARLLVENEMGLPPYVVAATALYFVCGTGLLYSASLWRLRRVRGASVSFALSGFSVFLGPFLLLKLLG